MRIYFSGVGGVGIGPLAEIAADAGYDVIGSDREASPMTEKLQSKGIKVLIGQSGSEMSTEHNKEPIDWFVHTAALPADHPELEFAHQNNIHISKRDEFIAKLLKDKGLNLVAVAGTHGKTTTTAMLIWILKQLKIPISYSVGTIIGFGESGQFDANSKYFIYECDEYDRNFLHFNPHLSLLTAIDYDHPDTYPNENDYRDAFIDFIEQSDYSIMWDKDFRYLGEPNINADYEIYDSLMNLDKIKLAGIHTRHNAFLAMQAVKKIAPGIDQNEILHIINGFPGNGRRFEKLADNLFSDYGHHPVEIAATLQMARELNDNVVLVYQPHQNLRQHEIKDQYTDCMQLADQIYWLPTYLTREKPDQAVLTPQQLSQNLVNRYSVHFSELDDNLWQNIDKARSQNKLVLIMGAGSIDSWVRNRLKQLS